MLLNVAATIDRMVVGAVAPALQASLHLSDGQLALAQGPAFGVPYALALPLAGWLVDRLGTRRALTGSAILWTAGLLLSAAASRVETLLVGRALTGVGQAMLTPAAFTLILGIVAPAAVGRHLTLFTGAGALGRGLAFGVGGVLLWAFEGWPQVSPWSATLVTLAIANLLVLIFGRHLLSTSPPRDRSGDVRDLLWRWLRTSPAPITAAVIAAVGTVAMVQALTAWVAVIVVRALAVTPATAALAIGAVSFVASPLGHVAGGLLADNDRLHRQAQIATTLLCIPTTLALVCARNLPLAMTAVAAMLLLTGIAGAGALVRVQRMLPEGARGSANGWFMMVVALVGVSGGPMMVPLLGGNGRGLGLGLVLTITVAAIVSAASAALVVDRRKNGAAA